MKQITEGQALMARQKQLGLSIWDLSDVDPEPELSALIPERLAKRLGGSPSKEKRRYPVCRNEKSGRFYGT